MEKLTIDRSKWRTGENDMYMRPQPGDFFTGRGHTQLLNSEGYMCCLGFMCLGVGLEPNVIAGVVSPDDCDKRKLSKLSNFDKKLLFKYNPGAGLPAPTDFTNFAMRINDDPKTSSEEKEKLISEHFATVGIEVEFIGEYEFKN